MAGVRDRKHTSMLEELMPIATHSLRSVYSPSTEYGPPPPAVILCGELEVSERHRDTCSNTEKNTIDNKQYPVQRVLFSTPQGGKDVIQLHRYGTAIVNM
jgi:hypothetical protein